MDSIQIDTGEKRIAINGDPERVITFNPNDVIFVEKFYKLIGEISGMQERYAEQIKEIDGNKVIGNDGLPVNFADRLNMWRAIHTEVQAAIDSIFGAGTSQKAFGGAMPFSEDMYRQFFNGIIPFIQSERSAKTAKYTRGKGK